MAYTKQNWVNDQTVVNAEHMNHIEDGIKDASDSVDTLSTAVSGLETAKHTHSNKTVLDSVTSAVVSNSHTHTNKTVIDKFGENSSGKPTYNGSEIGGGSGTVTSVSVKMNNTTKGTVTTSGTIDLGTVITEHQDISGKVDNTDRGICEALSNTSTTSSQSLMRDDCLAYVYDPAVQISGTNIRKTYRTTLENFWNYIKSKINTTALGKITEDDDGMKMTNTDSVYISSTNGDINLESDNTEVTGDLNVIGQLDLGESVVGDIINPGTDGMTINAENGDLKLKSESKRVEIFGYTDIDLYNDNGDGVSVSKTTHTVTLNVGDEAIGTIYASGLTVDGDISDSVGTLASVRNTVNSAVDDGFISRNLFSTSFEQGGISSDGSDSSDIPNLRCRTPMNAKIFLKAGTYTVNDLYVTGIVVYGYSSATSTKASYGVSQSWHTVPYTFTLATDYYVRIAVKHNNDEITPNNFTNIQLEKGSTATSYTPYAKSNVELTNELATPQTYTTTYNGLTFNFIKFASGVKLVTFSGTMSSTISSSIAYWNLLFNNIPNDFKPIMAQTNITIMSIAGGIIQCQVRKDGSIIWLNRKDFAITQELDSEIIYY